MSERLPITWLTHVDILVSEPLDYFRRMEVEPTPYGIIRWIERQYANHGEFDHKYARRLMDALVEVCGGAPSIAYRLACETDFKED